MPATSLFCATVHKASTSTPLGLHLWATPGGALIIAHIRDHGLFANKLKAGMQLERINDMPCVGLSLQQIEDHLAELCGRVSIMTKSPVLLVGRDCNNDQAKKGVSATTASTSPRLVEVSDDDDDDDDSSTSTQGDDTSTKDSRDDEATTTETGFFYRIPMVF